MPISVYRCFGHPHIYHPMHQRRNCQHGCCGTLYSPCYKSLVPQCCICNLFICKDFRSNVPNCRHNWSWQNALVVWKVNLVLNFFLISDSSDACLVATSSEVGSRGPVNAEAQRLHSEFVKTTLHIHFMIYIRVWIFYVPKYVLSLWYMYLEWTLGHRG